MKQSPAPAIVLIGRTSIQYFFDQEQFLLDFSPDIVFGVEVKNHDLLFDQISQFIRKNKINPGEFVSVLAEEVCLTREVETQDKVKEFLELVPFENIISKTYPSGKNFKVVATNRDYFEAIEACLEKNGFRAIVTTPLSVLGLDNVDGKSLFLKISQIKQLSMTNSAGFAGLDENQKETLRRNKRAMLMAIPFFLLLIILITMIMVLDPFGFNKKVPIRKASPTSKTIVSVENEQNVATQSSSVDTSKLTVKINNASGIKNLAGDTREIFKSLGFVEISVVNSSVQTPKSVLVYSASVSGQILETVITKLKQRASQLVVTQTASSEADLVLTLGKDQKNLPIDSN